MNEAPIWRVTPRPACLDRLQGTVQADIAIVGAGLTGLSTAYHLLAREPTLRVVILEAGQVGMGASSRSTGMLGPGVGQNLLGLVARLGDGAAAAIYRQTLDAVALVRDLVATENLACDLTMGGQILWARSLAGRRRLASQARWLNERGLPAEALDDASLRDSVRLPETAGQARGLPAALRFPLAGVLDPGRLVAGLANAAQVRGARIYQASPVSAVTGGGPGGRVALALQAGGEVLADQAVLATAGYTADLGWLRGRVIPMRIQALATEPIPAPLLADLGWARREGIIEGRRIFNYFRLCADNRLVFGGGAPRPCPQGTRQAETLPPGARQPLAHNLLVTFPELARQGIRITHGWSGTIGYVLNGLPLIGRSRDNPKILHAVGWSGHGIALGVAAGSWLADLIVHGATARARADALSLFSQVPPKVPCQPLHGYVIRAAGCAMQLLDRIA